MKHKSPDYKLSAVNYYFNHEDGYDNTCKIFDCKKSSLKRWIHNYKTSKNLTRKNRKHISYKITKSQVNTALELLKKNEQLTMNELALDMKQKYKDFDITPQHLGQIVRDNNKTRKRTRHEHFPKIRYNKETNKQKELDIFYKEVNKYSIDKIICLDETSIKPSMIPEYSRCSLGKRCVVKTDNSYFYRSFTLLVAICNSIYIGYVLYEKGGMTKERFVDFLKSFIFNKYKNYLIILDNAGSHSNQYVKDAIINSGNKYLYSICYTPKTNAPIEGFFNQIKKYLKLNKYVLKFNELKEEVKKAIKKVKPENYKNYFDYAYNKDVFKNHIFKKSTLRRKLKEYKD
jgi:transposase